MSYTKVETHVTQALDNFVYQFKDKPKLAAWITSYINQIQDLENMWYDLLVERWLENAVGVQLDNFGTIVLELRQGKDDDGYRFAIQGKIKLLRSQGTPTDVIQGMEFFAAGTYELIESYPATIRVILVDALTSAFPTLDQFVAFVDAVKPAGVQTWFQYALSDDENTFRFQDVEYQDTMMLGEDASRVGGYVMHDEGDGVIRNLGTGDAATNNGATNVITDLGDGLSFDGDDDFVNAGQVGASLTDNFTLSAWIKTSATGGRIIARRAGSGASCHFDWYVYSDGRIDFYEGTNSHLGLTSIDDGLVHHVAVSINGSNSQHYVDGVADGSTFSQAISTVVIDTLIGKYSSALFDGQILDPQIFSEAKDATWVAAEYAKGITAMANNQSADYPVHRAHIDTLDSSVLAAYRMKPTNGVTGSNVPNLVGGAEAAVNNGATFEYTSHGDALLFDGTDDFLNAGSVGASLTDDFTLSAWIKTSKDGSRIIGRRDGSGTHFEWYVSTTGALSIYDGVAERLGSAELSDSAWHHVVTIVNGTSSQHYVDGTTDGSTFTPVITTYTTDTKIGNTGLTGSGDFEGHICDPQIHDEAKDAAWVLAEYNKMAAVMAYNGKIVMNDGDHGEGLIEVDLIDSIIQPDPSLLAAYDMESQTIYGTVNQVPNRAWHNRVVDGSMEKQGVADFSAGNSATLSKKQTSPYSGNQWLEVRYGGTGSYYAAQGALVANKVYQIIGRGRGDDDGTVPKIYTAGEGIIWEAEDDSSAWTECDKLTIASGASFRLYGIGPATVNNFAGFDSIGVYEYDNKIVDDCSSANGAATVDSDDWYSGATLTKPSAPTTNEIRVTGPSSSQFFPSVNILIAGHEYRIVCKARGDGVSNRPDVRSGSFIWGDGTTSNTWQDVDETFIADEAALRFYSFGASGYVEFKDLILIDLDEDPSTHSDSLTNQLTDGDCEDTTVSSDWIIDTAGLELSVAQPDPSLLAAYDMESQTIYGTANQIPNRAWHNRVVDGSMEKQGVDAGWSTPGSYCTLSKTQTAPFSGNQSLRATNLGSSASIATIGATTAGKVYRVVAAVRGDGGAPSQGRLGNGFSQFWISPSYTTEWQEADEVYIAGGSFVYLYNSGALNGSTTDLDSLGVYEYDNKIVDDCSIVNGAVTVDSDDWTASAGGVLTKQTDNVLRVTSDGAQWGLAQTVATSNLTGKNLRIVGQFRGDGSSGRVRMTTGGGGFGEYSTTSNTWQDFDVEYVGTSSTIYIYCADNIGYGEVRNLILIDLDAGPSTHSDSLTNQLVDGDCESLTGWSNYNSATLSIDATIVYKGSGSIQIDTNGTQRGIYQTAMSIGKSYRIRGHVYMDGAIPIARVYDGDPTGGGVLIWSVTGNDTWYGFDESFTATSADLYFTINDEGSFTGYYDDLILEELDEHHTDATNANGTNATEDGINMLDLNGSTAMVTASTDVSPFAYQTQSIGVWFKAHDFSGYDGIIGNDNYVNTTQQWLRRQTPDYVVYSYGTGTSSESADDAGYVQDTLYFASVSRLYDGTNTYLYLYMNGELVGTDITTGSPDVSIYDFVIGRITAAYYFDGLIGAPVAFNEAKDADFWLVMYNRGTGLSKDTTNVYKGLRSLKVSNAGTLSKIYQAKATIGKAYRLRLHGWNDTGAGEVLSVYDGDPDGAGVLLDSTTLDDTWAGFDLNYTATSTDVYFVFENDSGVEGYLDDLILEQLDENHTNATNANGVNSVLGIGNAIDLNGTDAVVTGSTDVSPFAYQTHSLGVWFASRDLSKPSTGLITNGTLVTTVTQRLTTTTGGLLGYIFSNGTSAQANYESGLQEYNLHLASISRTYDGTNTSLQMYIDGQQVHTGSVVVVSPDISTIDFLIGWLSGTGYFDGLISIPQAYNEGKDAAFWLAQYTAGLAAIQTNFGDIHGWGDVQQQVGDFWSDVHVIGEE